jgi:hypothetical protein
MFDLIKKIPSYMYWWIALIIYLMVFENFKLLDSVYFVFKYLVFLFIIIQAYIIFFLLRFFYREYDGEFSINNMKEFLYNHKRANIELILSWLVLFILSFFVPGTLRIAAFGIFLISTLLFVLIFLAYILVIKLYRKFFRRKYR